jgi:hypothetical protein
MNGEGQNESGDVGGRIRGRWWERQDWDKRSWRSDRLDAVGWAAIFIWAGLVLLAENTGYAADFYWWYGWFVFFAGAGIIVIMVGIVRAIVPAFRRRVMTTFVIGFILLSIGLGMLFDLLWPFLLISFGIIILVRAFVRRS